LAGWTSAGWTGREACLLEIATEVFEGSLEFGDLLLEDGDSLPVGVAAVRRRGKRSLGGLVGDLNVAGEELGPALLLIASLTGQFLHEADFGEALVEPCGHCDRCRGLPVRPVPRSTPPAPNEEDWTVLRGLVKARPAALGTARQLARFLCGLTSPATTREKLTRHDAFGLFAHLPFAEVLAIAESQ